MPLALFALATFAAAFALHAVLWRVRLPASHTAALLAIFLGTLPAALLLGALWPALAPYAPRAPWQYLLAATFHVALSLAYVAFYSAIEGDSPSCQIVSAVARAGAAGLRRGDLGGVIDNESVLMSRIRAMVRDRMVFQEGEALRLTPEGRLLARFYLAVERLFGLPRGG
jgi:hypothetical protein